jgi:hypothetical protein
MRKSRRIQCANRTKLEDFCKGGYVRVAVKIIPLTRAPNKLMLIRRAVQRTNEN